MIYNSLLDYFISFFGRSHSLWTFSGQGSNPSQSCYPRHCSWIFDPLCHSRNALIIFELTLSQIWPQKGSTSNKIPHAQYRTLFPACVPFLWLLPQVGHLMSSKEYIWQKVFPLSLRSKGSSWGWGLPYRVRTGRWQKVLPGMSLSVPPPYLPFLLLREGGPVAGDVLQISWAAPLLPEPSASCIRTSRRNRSHIFAVMELPFDISSAIY